MGAPAFQRRIGIQRGGRDAASTEARDEASSAGCEEARKAKSPSNRSIVDRKLLDKTIVLKALSKNGASRR